jgi:RNA polymerase sigma factor for flagellar operon FliA
VLEYYPLVRRIAFGMARRFPACVDGEDLVNIGMIGLIDAVDRYEPDRGASFTGYLRIRVQGAIVDEMRKNDWVPRSVRDRGDRLGQARASLLAKLDREPTDEELAQHLGVPLSRLAELRDRSAILQVVSLDDGADGEPGVADVVPCSAQTPHDLAEAEGFRAQVRALVHELPERERMIVDLYYTRELGFKEIGQVLGVTESRISQLHTRVMSKLRARIEAMGGID